MRGPEVGNPLAMERLRRASAFTLIELLVVILILGILIAVAVPAFLGQTEKAHDSAAKQYLTIGYRSAVAIAVDGNGNPSHNQGYYVDGSFDETALAGALHASEPELTFVPGDCPFDATTDLTRIVIDIAVTQGRTLQICNDPIFSSERTVWVLTTTAGTVASLEACTPTGCPSEGSAPVNDGSQPAISNPSAPDPPAVGDTLSASAGGWNGNPAPAFSYQWQNCAAPSGGSCINVGTGDGYGVQASDEGDYIQLIVSATNASGSAAATSARLGPVAAAPSLGPLSPVAAVAAGSPRACALLANGTVKCWGDSTWNNLIDPNWPTTPCCDPGYDPAWDTYEYRDGTTPVTITGLANVTQLDLGYHYACALISGGTIKCWGEGAHGELGDGTFWDQYYAPAAPVAVSGISNATAIATGAYHACALFAGGTAQCWGQGTLGQLGNGVLSSQATPVVVSGLSGATQLAAGAYHACALLAAGTVKCWGYNNYGLGNGGTLSSTPVTVSGISNAVAIAAGSWFTCALLSGGQITCWGQNTAGALGDGSYINHPTPITSVTGITNATAISALGAHACALLASGAVKCWGQNQVGELGDGTIDTSSPYGKATPVIASGITNATQVDAGVYLSCARLADSTAMCWGTNTAGAVGDGTTTSPRPTPVQVIG